MVFFKIVSSIAGCRHQLWRGRGIRDGGAEGGENAQETHPDVPEPGTQVRLDCFSAFSYLG